ncbi:MULTISPECIES: hypothetical protein [unclassified Saccharopolyspora]|uniref:hypothetical protein n=1 Tax=Saccharopolyspora TaxID=1835 RepID=UPI00190D8A50|nr:hypothetical protein [Saccharopolyspora sp. HNM0986]MBK0870640.1 hypothetical protein [Saccharopolyspora sp. HNM0986]
MRRRLRPDRKGLVRFAYPGRERTVIIVAAVFNTPDSSAPRVVSALSAITWGELTEQDRQFFPAADKRAGIRLRGGLGSPDVERFRIARARRESRSI